MKSKKMVAALTKALKEAALVKSGGEKIFRRINDTAKKISRKINRRIDIATGQIPKKATRKAKKQAEKNQKKTAAGGSAIATA